jgi:hypothetical protein
MKANITRKLFLYRNDAGTVIEVKGELPSKSEDTKTIEGFEIEKIIHDDTTGLDQKKS